MNIFAPGLQFYVDKLNNGERFAFTRYGNGEWDCIFNLYPRTRSGSQTFTPTLRRALTATLTDHPAGQSYAAMQSVQFLERVKLLQHIEPWVTQNAPALQWHDGEVWAKASRNGTLFPFVEAIRKYNVVVVGPPHLLTLPFARVFVPVKARNCWDDVDKLTDVLSAHTEAVILFSAGPTAKVLIHRLYPQLKHSWMIDCGSLWDVYCGVRSRRYHKSILSDVLHKNLTGK